MRGGLAGPGWGRDRLPLPLRSSGANSRGLLDSIESNHNLRELAAALSFLGRGNPARLGELSSNRIDRGLLGFEPASRGEEGIGRCERGLEKDPDGSGEFSSIRGDWEFGIDPADRVGLEPRGLLLVLEGLALLLFCSESCNRDGGVEGTGDNVLTPHGAARATAVIMLAALLICS